MQDIKSDINSLFQYVDIYCEEQRFVFSLGFNSSRRRLPAKWCTQEDFDNGNYDIEIFNYWVGFGIVCPDFKNDSSFSLYKDGLYYKYATININFDMWNSQRKLLKNWQGN